MITTSVELAMVALLDAMLGCPLFAWVAFRNASLKIVPHYRWQKGSRSTIVRNPSPSRPLQTCDRENKHATGENMRMKRDGARHFLRVRVTQVTLVQHCM